MSSVAQGNAVARKFAEAAEEVEALDRIADPLQSWVKENLKPGTLKDLLSGTWLGHPLHPLLTDVVIGSWTSALMLDVLAGKHARKASQRLVGLGILAALPTAATGLSDWAELWGKTRRVGTAHATGNVTALSLFFLSWRARRKGHHFRGYLWSFTGFGVATYSAYLGAQLTYDRGVGVPPTTFEDWPGDWTPVISESEVPAGELVGAKAGDAPVVLVREGEQVFALADKCTHRGCPLHEGELNDDGTLTCMCHGSTFRIANGEIVRGPATSPQPSYEVRVSEGKVEVKLPRE